MTGGGLEFVEPGFLYPQRRVLVSPDWHAVLSTGPVEARRKDSQVSWHLHLEYLQQGYFSNLLAFFAQKGKHTGSSRCSWGSWCPWSLWRSSPRRLVAGPCCVCRWTLIWYDMELQYVFDAMQAYLSFWEAVYSWPFDP